MKLKTFLLFVGFGERLLTEVKKLAPKDVKIKVGAGPVSSLVDALCVW